MKPTKKTFRKSSLLSRAVALMTLLTMMQCQSTSEVLEEPEGWPKDGFPKWNTYQPLDQLSSLSGSVRIRLEPHGSIRAKVYSKGAEQFEYILDREKPQQLLTKNIRKADVHLLRINEDRRFIVGIAIDDLETGQRYVLDPGQRSCPWAREQTKQLPDLAKKTVVIDGYGGSFTQDPMRFEDPL
ncbi:hypothetical protein LX87_01606 [Larkinella arboricola]|uniref:Uncharacterized protein n=1 Tax=Larkinella arboricola TaxID=643671 RepID=A0A327X1B8_LARAB|nr:hypothetical protein [Larkinella arboricola]RAJ99909.1 hypothetical protein LX87_01606 [Larkinella arboricola]